MVYIDGQLGDKTLEYADKHIAYLESEITFYRELADKYREEIKEMLTLALSNEQEEERSAKNFSPIPGKMTPSQKLRAIQKAINDKALEGARRLEEDATGDSPS